MNYTKNDILEYMNSSTISTYDKCNMLLLALEEISDWKYLQDLYLKYATNDDEDIAGLSITCIGHLARIHQTIDIEAVNDVFKFVANKSKKLNGRIEDALEDINIFIK